VRHTSPGEKQKTHLPVLSAVGWLQSCIRRLLTKLDFHPYKTQRPLPSFADDNRQRSLESKSSRAQ
jgi:hypothetical protein